MNHMCLNEQGPPHTPVEAAILVLTILEPDEIGIDFHTAFQQPLQSRRHAVGSSNDINPYQPNSKQQACSKPLNP